MWWSNNEQARENISTVTSCVLRTMSLVIALVTSCMKNEVRYKVQEKM